MALLSKWIQVIAIRNTKLRKGKGRVAHLGWSFSESLAVSSDGGAIRLGWWACLALDTICS